MSGKHIDDRDDVLGLTDAYVHGLLSDQDRGYVEDQAKRSAVWRAALEAARGRLAAMQSVPGAEPSEALLERAFNAANASARTVDRKRYVFTRVLPALFAAAALVLIGVHAYLAALSPGRFDLRVLGQTTLAAGGEASIRVCLFEQAGGRPVTGSPVEVSLSGQDGKDIVLASFKTDAEGTGSPRYVVPDWKDGEYQLRVRAAGRETFTRTVTLTRTGRVMLSTDKPVYQPGQTIHMRTLALRRADSKPVSGEEAVFLISDPKGTIIFKQRAVTSDYGLTSADCPLAEEILHGTYTIKCTVAGTESERTVEIKPYALPKFRVDVRINDAFLQPGQLVRGNIEAVYFFGQPLAGASAMVEVTAPDSGFKLPLQVQLDQEGHGAFEFRAPDRLVATGADGPDARLVITATVTDSAGQIETRSASRVVAAKPLRIEIVPESGSLLPGEPNRVYVLVTTPDGRPAASAKLSISGLDHSLTASDMGVASFELTPPPLAEAGKAGTRVTITATDLAGRSASRTFDLSSRSIADDFLLRTDAAEYAAGGTVTISVMGKGTEPVFVDLLKDGQTALTKTVPVTSGKGEIVIDLPPDVSGTLQIVAYRFDTTGVAARRTRAIVVDRADDLHVVVKPDKPQYKPGERATLNVDLTDAAGKPTQGAVSIAAVDEAVFSVLDQAPGMERTLLLLDDALLKPVYTLYPWTLHHGEQLTPSERELGLALFASTAQERIPDRRAVLQRLVDEGYISSDMLEVLDRPDAERMIADMQQSGVLTDDAAAILRGGGATEVHSMSGSTWPEKVRRVEARKHDWTNYLKGAWVILGLAAVVALLAALVVYAPSPVTALVFILLGLTCFGGVLLPSLGKARASARQIKAATEMRAIGQAIELAGLKPMSDSAGGGSAPRIRQWFPETLLWRPELITDASGHAAIEVDLADSITTWRIFGGAVTRDGRLGSLQGAIGVFQPFFVDVNAPAGLTRGDEVAVPMVVYNYLDQPQSVRLTAKQDDWFSIVGGAEQTIDVPARAVRTAYLRIRAGRAGPHDLEVSAVAPTASDAIRRTMEVQPGGQPLEVVHSGSLSTPLLCDIDVPSDLIDGSGHLFVKVYPSPLSQFVEGLEGIFQAPYGCFEQTSSTTYPNVLALEYLKRSGKAVPSVEATARKYINLGYQRLVSFEVDGGGFDWFGHPPANRLLTAYGLMEFVDMSRVHDVDPALIDRTRRWLLSQRRSNGSWAPELHSINDGLASSVRGEPELVTTAYLAWAVFAHGGSAADVGPTRAWLASVNPEGQDDPYVVALMAHATAAVGSESRPWLQRLVALQKRSTDGKLVWWTRPEGARTAFYGAGRSGDVEATALATLAILDGHGDATAARGALTWLTERRDPRGTWGTTQATVLALRALVAAADAPLGEPVAREVVVEVDGKAAQRVMIDPDHAEVLQLVDLSRLVSTGRRHIVVRQERGPAAQAQVVFRCNVPGQPPTGEDTASPLVVSTVYDRDALRVGEELRASVTLKNTTGTTLPMVMLDLPVPPGFEPRRADFDAMVTRGAIAKYEVTARQVIVYLTSLPQGAPLQLDYRMRAAMPVTVQADGPTAYEYYSPERRCTGRGVMLSVNSPS